MPFLPRPVVTFLMMLLLLLLLPAACRGPKGAPDSSVKSYYSAAAAQDYDALVDTVSESTLKRIGSRGQALAYFERQYAFWKNVDVSIVDWSVTGDGLNATVSYTCVAQSVGANYKPLNIDCSDTWSAVKEGDDKWHVVLPGAQRLRTIQ